MDPLTERIQAIVERCKARAEDPEFQAQAERLRRENAAFEAASRQAQRNLDMHLAGVPKRLWPLLDKPDPTPALEAARAWLSGPEGCVFLVLAGEVGTGKSVAAYWAAAQGGGRHIDAHSLVLAGTFDPVWAELALAPVLALDELGAEHLNDAYRASLYSLLNARYSHGRRTLLVTNLGGEAFLARYCADGDADRLRDRLRTGGRWVSTPGKSLRRHWADDKETEP